MPGVSSAGYREVIVTTHVAIEFLAPLGTDPLDYRNSAEQRASELGWPSAHSAGTWLASESHLIAELGWEVVGDAGDVIAVLESDFYVRSVSL